MIFQGTCQFVSCTSFSTIVCASLQVLLNLCLVYSHETTQDRSYCFVTTCAKLCLENLLI